MLRKKRLWTQLLMFVLTALFVAACSSTTGKSPGVEITPQTMMTDIPGTIKTQVPGEMMESTVGATVPGTGMMDFDQMFINMMVPHHQGAVEMAKIAQQRAEHPETKQMADAIVFSQEEEIIQMQGWLEQWYGASDTPPMSAVPMLEAMPEMGGPDLIMDMQADVDRLRNAAEPFDLAFIDAMIPHHQSAIDAANLALNQASRPEIKEMARAIIDAQETEINQLNEWRKAWYPDAPPPSMPTH